MLVRASATRRAGPGDASRERKFPNRVTHSQDMSKGSGARHLTQADMQFT